MGKRKLLTVILLAFVTTLMFACAVMFTACGNNETPDDGHNTEQGGDNPDDGDEPGTNPGTDPDDDKDIVVTSVSLDKTSLTLEVGENYTLVVTVSPSNATDKIVTWSSTNSSVAAVSGGKVTAKSEGTTTITATAHNGKKASCTVTVNEPATEVIEVTSVSLNKTSLTLEIGENETLTATVMPSNATDKSVTWTSSDQAVATVANGKITAVGSGIATITATASNGKTAICTVTVNAAVPKITQVEGATIDGTDIFMLVDHMTDSVALLNKVTVSSGRWDLYSDIFGQNRIPTKIAAGSNGKLQNGDNMFYIMLENENGDLAEVYTLTVYRSYAVTVSYYNHKNILVYSDTAYTGYEYVLNYDYTTPGYTFNNWTENGAIYQARILWDGISLYANMTANTYTVELDTAGGILDEPTQTVIYDKSYAFPVPTRTGYTFLGWYSGDVLLADAEDETSSSWQYTNIISATAKWQINQYYIAVRYENGSAVEGAGAGTYNYGTEISLTAPSPNLGYTFLGWYLEDKLLTEAIVHKLDVPAKNMTLTVKYEPLNEMSVYNFTSTPTTCTITGIKDKTVTCIVVPDYVTNIGKGAFFECSNLTDITLPFVGAQKEGNENTHFGYIFGADSYDYNDSYVPASLKTVIITSGTRVEDYAFSGCSSLTNITLSNNIISIGEEAFSGCKNLIQTENGINYVDKWVVDCDSSVISVMLRHDTVGIADSAFYNCTNLTNITFSDNMAIIGYKAFYNCDGLTNISIPGSVTRIAGWAFINCSNLTSVMIENGVASIGSEAFRDCNSLTSITIPDSMTRIYQFAFYGCSGLTEVHITNLAAWCKIEFDNSMSNPLYYAHNLYLNGKLITDLVIPDGVTLIGDYAFYNCGGLISVTISNSVGGIGEFAFTGCENMISVIFEESNGWYCDSIRFSSDDLSDPAIAAEYLQEKNGRWTLI